MKKIEEIKATIQKSVASMTVVEMRKAASQYGIKNAKQYKRVQLFELLYSAMVEKAIAEAEAQAKTAKKAKATKSGSKSVKGSNKSVDTDVEEAMEYLVNGSAKTDTKECIKSILMVYGRQVLIRVMANLKVKRWYRIYDKPTMVDKIVECVAA